MLGCLGYLLLHLRVLDRIQRLGDLSKNLHDLELRVTASALGHLLLLLLLLLRLRIAISYGSRRVMWNLLGVLHLLLLRLCLHWLLRLGQLADSADKIFNRLLLLSSLAWESLSGRVNILSLYCVLRGCLGLSLRLIDTTLNNLCGYS